MSRKFCANCGAGLWISCFQCEAEVSVSEKFCGSCGVNLAEHLVGIRNAFEEQRQQAEDFAKNSQFDEAIACAAVLLKQVHPSLKREAEALKQRTEDWEAQRDQTFEKIGQLQSEAERAFEDLDYQKVVRLLSKIDAGARTDAITELLANSHHSLTEIDRLKKQVDAGIKAKKSADLLPILERLIALCPHEPKPQKIAETIRDRLVGLADKRLREGNYEEAWKTISRVRLFVESQDSERLRQAIENRYWMVKALRNAPLTEPLIIQVAERLAKTAGEHPVVKKLVPEIRKRSQQVVNVRPAQFMPWAKSTEKSRWGDGVDHFQWYEAFGNAEQLDKQGGAYGARFAVAAGLALQGLGLAKIPFDLSGQTKKGWVAKVRGSMGKKNTKACGLQFGTTSLKMIRLESTGTDSPPQIRESFVIPYDMPISMATSDFERRDEFRKALAELKRHTNLDDTYCVASLSTVPTLPRFVELPAIDAKKLSATVETELTHQIPFPLNEVNVAHHIGEVKEKNAKRFLLIVAARKAEMAIHVELIASLDVKLAEIQDEGLALYNLVEFVRGNKVASQKCGMEGDAAVAVVGSGGDGTQVVIATPDRPWYRYVPQGGVRMTRLVAANLKLATDKAEAMKREPARSKDVAAVIRALNQPMRDLFEEVDRTIDAAIKDTPSLRPTRLLMTGGNSLTPGFVWAFRSGPDAVPIMVNERARTNA